MIDITILLLYVITRLGRFSLLTYNLERRGKTSLYESLYHFIKSDILSGKLKSGEKLPSKRGLAQHLKISVITVENAYAQLIAEGYVFALEKSGYFVSRVEEAVKSVKKPVFSEERTEQKEYFMDFQKNSVFSEIFPFSVWAKTMREIILLHDKKLLAPVEHNGSRELREAVAFYLYHSRGMTVNPEHIIIGAGTEYLYNLITQLLGRDKIYAVENPGYTKIAKIYGINGISREHISLDAEGLSVSALCKTKSDVVHISPAHHYPTGIVMPIGRRQSLLRWANEKDGRYILEDDYDSEFRFAGKPIETMFGIDGGEKVIYINTFSKTIAPSIRISYMVLPAHLFEKYKKEMDFYSCTVPSFEQYTLAKFIMNGSFEKHINRTKKMYRQRRDCVISAIKESPFTDIVTINEEKAGLHFLMKIKTDVSDSELKRQAEREDIRLAFMSDYLFLPDKKYEHILIINYSGIDLSRLKETLSRLYGILKTPEI